LGLRIEIIGNRSDSYVNHSTRSQSKRDGGSELIVLELVTYHTSTQGWIDTHHDLGQVRKWPLQMPPMLPSSERGQELSLKGFQVLGVSNVDREAEWMRIF